MKLKELKFHLLKNMSIAIAVVCLSFTSYSQIDSVNVNITFTSEIDSAATDSLGNYIMVDAMNVNADIYDVDFMGEVIVTVYDTGTNYPLAMVKMTAQEFIDENLKVGNTVTTILLGIDPANSYTVTTQVRNFQGGNLPIVTTNYSL